MLIVTNQMTNKYNQWLANWWINCT